MRVGLAGAGATSSNRFAAASAATAARSRAARLAAVSESSIAAAAARVARRARRAPARRTSAGLVRQPHLSFGRAAPANCAGRFSLNDACASAKSGCCMHNACACASASIAAPSAIVCSLSSICLVIECANAGPCRELGRPLLRDHHGRVAIGHDAIDEADPIRVLRSRSRRRGTAARSRDRGRRCAATDTSRPCRRRTTRPSGR